SERALRTRIGRQAIELADVAQSETAQVVQVQLPRLRNVAKCVAATIPVFVGVRHLADSDAVEHHPDHALDAHCASSESMRLVMVSTKVFGSNPSRRLATWHVLSKRIVAGMLATLRSRARPSSK